MTIKIFLLRGINVGGHNKLPMQSLKDLAKTLGATDAEHYLQSGNLVLRGDIDANSLAKAIEIQHGFKPKILIRDLTQWTRLVDGNPFSEVTDPKALHAFFLSEPTRLSTDELSKHAGADERLLVTPEHIYLHTPKHLSGSKVVVNLEKLVNVSVTARNWRTVEKVYAVAKAMEE